MDSGCCEVKRQVRASWWSARDKCGTDRRALTWASWHFWLSGLYLPSLSCQWAMRPSRRFRDTVKSLLPVFRGETRSVRNINLKHSSKDRFIYRIKGHIIMYTYCVVLNTARYYLHHPPNAIWLISHLVGDVIIMSYDKSNFLNNSA